MKILYFIFSIIIINCNVLFGQETGVEKVIRTYEISLNQYPQKIKLTEYRNERYKGLIITEFYKGKVKDNNLINRILRKKSKEVIDSMILDPKIIQTLIIKLKNEGIETIKDCKDDEQCKSIAFLDGGSVGFKISTESFKREYSFQEIYPYKTNNLEDTPLRKQAQKLLTTIDESLDLETKFNIIRSQLPRKFYHYFGNGFSFMQLKNK